MHRRDFFIRDSLGLGYRVGRTDHYLIKAVIKCEIHILMKQLATSNQLVSSTAYCPKTVRFTSQRLAEDIAMSRQTRNFQPRTCTADCRCFLFWFPDSFEPSYYGC